MRKFSPGWVLPGVVVAALLATACSGPSRPNPAPTHTFSAQIKAGQTGTYKLGDLTVTVPAGAVPRDTQLISARPETTGPLASPLGLPSVSFDLSLANDAEPSKPLEVSIPLKGAYLLNGAKPAQALLYTTTQAKRRGWDLVPSTVDANGVLHAQLGHLSLKAISYVSDQTLMQLADVVQVPATIGNPPDCPSSVDIPDGKVQFTDAQGWSNKGDSPVRACLGKDSNGATLSIRNKLNYILQVAATDGLDLRDATDTTNDALVVLLAKRIFPDKKVKAYLGRDGQMDVAMPTKSLPATVQLRAEPDTFLAEAAWSSLKFLVGILTGVQGDDLTNLIKRVADSSDVIDCLHTTLNVSQGDTPSVGDVLEWVSSKCTETIVNALGVYAASKSAWDQFWGRFYVIGQGVSTTWNTFWTAVDGIKMQFVGTISMSVDNVAPTCVSNDEAVKLIGRVSQDGGPVRIYPQGIKICEGTWALTQAQTYWNQPNAPWSDGYYVILHYKNDAWGIYRVGGTSKYFLGPPGSTQYDDALCNPLPKRIKSEICVPWNGG